MHRLLSPSRGGLVSMPALVVGALFGLCSRSEADQRLDRLAERRAGPAIMVHRGAAEFAHENTLEAYRAALELGADGSEIDVRATRDGVLICFHDDMLDHLLDAIGDASDYDWETLQRFEFRRPGPYGDQCRIPTLEEALLLHRCMAGLVQLDIKRPGLEDAIIRLIDRHDLWPHVASAPGPNASRIRTHPRYEGLEYKVSLYADHSDVVPDAISAGLGKPGVLLMVDDPRAAILVCGREIGRVSRTPVARQTRRPPPYEDDRSVFALQAILSDHGAANSAPQGDVQVAARSKAIERRARAAAEVLRRRLDDPELLAYLAGCVRQRSLSPRWQDHGLDGAMALRALAVLDPPQFVQLARFCLWRDDPAVELVKNPKWDNPRSWTDFRTKLIVFGLLEQYPHPGGADICRDYLALDSDEARRIGVPQYEQAARALLAIDPTTDTAVELMQHRKGEVRGRAILICVREAGHEWAREALEQAAPYALEYVTGE